ncbi:MAG: hypothetical protein LC118_08055 [Dehalococcoidia bacterium]|nr:hypothetical protein [Dehalococcoidia bacterium]
MPAGRGPVKGSGAIHFPGVPRPFATPEQAAAFLRHSPKYVAKHARLIAQRAPGAFAKAGYTIKGDTLYHEGPRTVRGPGGGPVQRGATKPRTTPAPTPAPGSGQTTGVDATTTGIDAPVIDLSGLDSLNPNVGQLLSTKLAKGGAKLFRMGAADQIAGLQFDPQIQDLAAQQLQAPRDTAQQKKDVGGWYQQVLNSLRTAGKRDTAATKAGVDSIGEATKAIVGSLGGEANQGSALVGASGADAVGTLAALGAVQDQYNADLAPLLQSEKAGALSRVEAAGTSRLHDLALKLAQAKGQRGQAKGAARLQIQGENNQILDNRNKTLIDILNANNGLAQQRYSNAFGQETARISAGVSGAKIVSDILQASKPSGASRTYTYAKAPSATKGDWLAQLDSAAQKWSKDPAKAFIAMRNITNGYGWSVKNPAVMAGLKQVASKYGINF